MMNHQHYYLFSQGLSVIREYHDEEGDWYPPVILPYYWKQGPLWVCCCRPQLGYDKACPIGCALQWPEHTDFFVMNGVMLYGYPKINGYMPVYLDELQRAEAILF